MSITLADLNLQTSYHKGEDDIAEAFYLPSMRRATRYDRAVGFFRSTVFLIAWPALRDFVLRGGKMRVLCSQVLSDADIEALETGHAAQIDEQLAARLRDEVSSMLEDPVLREPARVLAALVARGALEVKIAVLRDTEKRSARGRIFHDKLGIFADDSGNTVIFKGSMNETWIGLAADGNLESVDIAASWLGERDRQRMEREVKYFSSLWANQYPKVNVRSFPEVAKSELERAADPDWERTVERMTRRGSSETPADPFGRTLKPHQAAGLDSWYSTDRKGILAFATGSGKTFTAITAIREALVSRHEIPVIIVPDKVLFGQWLDELGETLRDLDVHILRAGAGHNSWMDNLRLWTQLGEQRRLVIATVQTACSEEFRARLTGGTHLLLVADEVHRLGSPKHRTLLDDSLFGARLGLSATPERAGDPEGTAALLAFFHRILEPRYSLADAVRDEVLCRYFYRPHVVELAPEEYDEWKAITADLSKLFARKATTDGAEGMDEKIRRLLLRRARIVKRAAGKIQLAVDVISQCYKRSERQKWIVYCDDLEQLNSVSQALTDSGHAPLPFHSQMDGDRAATLRWLERRGGIIVAIRCLDEGVDVPSITHALILASSKNPREFIQRRGRVLRHYSGKSLAHVHDVIVVPPPVLEDGPSRPDPITAGEIARALEFASHADNPASAADLRQIAITARLDWRTLVGQGVEDVDD